MKVVRFNRAYPPWNSGEERAVPDDIADRLATEGHAEIVPSVFDDQKTEAPKGRRVLTRARESLL